MNKLVIIVLLSFLAAIEGRKHHLEIRDDIRRYIPLSTFGFYKSGRLDVSLSEFQVEHGKENSIFGLSLDKTLSDAMNQNLDLHQEKCFLEGKDFLQSNEPTVFFVMDFKKKEVQVNCSKTWRNMNIFADDSVFGGRRKRDTEPSDQDEMVPCSIRALPLIEGKSDERYTFYSFKFVMFVREESDEGLYNLYLHSCPNYAFNNKDLYSLGFNADIEENNHGNYLSAGEMPLPGLYFMMSLLFFLSGLFWVYMLRRSKHPVFKIHYLMAVLVFLKSLSLMFHSINFHFIEIKGEHVEAWAILYYITHLMKGAVLFITIVLIGTGWTFIKHILGDKDKKIFMIVIPLQVLANVAEIIIEESEEGSLEHSTWRDIFILVDLLCCAAILFPVVWSIRHLQEASATDGKAAVNLRKLKLFRQFYIMIVCYIYFTRIIVFLLKITVAFQYAWLDEMFREMATYVFFVLTGYKFRPTTEHPYFNIRDLEDDDEVEILTQSGLTENIRNVTNRNQNQPTTTSVEVFEEDEKENLINKRESSHEYD